MLKRLWKSLKGFLRSGGELFLSGEREAPRKGGKKRLIRVYFIYIYTFNSTY